MRLIETDGELDARELGLETAAALEHAGPWGQGFPEPCFDGCFVVEELRVVGEHHAKYRLRPTGGSSLKAIHFNGAETAAAVGDSVELVYKLVVNRWRGDSSAELMIEQLRVVSGSGAG